ncbi:replication/maintenance protein RepL [Streptomyces exfoliatus]|uniref:replication/maintenance protein RepL n=1 Tax=Streptomyces exfoliatus TaxID=1905 RepID=UPI003C30255A
MAQSRRRSAEAGIKAVRPAPAPAPQQPDSIDGLESARDLLTRLEELGRKGGTFTTKGDPKPYAFYGRIHLSMSQRIQDQLWKFGFSAMARNVLDHMSVHHDDQALVKMTQRDLAEKFGCSQSKVSRSIGELSKQNFAWKETRGMYRLHPLYAYRWGSEKQRGLVNKLGPKVLTAREIIIPNVRKAER